MFGVHNIYQEIQPFPPLRWIHSGVEFVYQLHTLMHSGERHGKTHDFLTKITQSGRSYLSIKFSEPKSDSREIHKVCY